MPDADFAERIAIGEIGDRVHLLGGGVARRPALGLQRQRDDRHSPAPCAARPNSGTRRSKRGICRCAPLQLGRRVRQPFVVGIAEARGDVGDQCRIDRQRAILDGLPFRFDLGGELLGAELVDENLDARLVDVVAAAVLIVDAQDRLDVAQQIALVQERLDGLADERRAAEPAADDHLEAGLARAVPVQPQADVVHAHGGAIVRRRRDRDLELARQERELRMHGRMLPEDFRVDARVLDLVGRDAGPLIGGDVAHAIAAGLHAVQAGLAPDRPSRPAGPTA